MPPRHPIGGEPLRGAIWKALKDDWDLLVERMKGHEISIPDYRSDGLLFSFGPKGGEPLYEEPVYLAMQLGKGIVQMSGKTADSWPADARAETPTASFSVNPRVDRPDARPASNCLDSQGAVEASEGRSTRCGSNPLKRSSPPL